MLRRMQFPLASALALAAGLALSSPANAELYAEEIKTARALAQVFQKSLKEALMTAISEGGPRNAIAVCNTEAPQIAAALSERSGWQVGRTALRVRNPDNAPTTREAAVLRDFQQSIAAGEAPKSLEAYAVAETGDGRRLHYMKAIPTAELCTVCHGENVDPELLATIREIYPQDEATGFKPGELRGAFSFYKPLGAE